MNSLLLNPHLILQEKYSFNGTIIIPLELNTDDRTHGQFSLQFVYIDNDINSVQSNAIGQPRTFESKVFDERTDDIFFLQDNWKRNWVEINGQKWLCISGSWYQDDDNVHYHQIRVVDRNYGSHSLTFETHYDGGFYCAGEFI